VVAGIVTVKEDAPVPAVWALPLLTLNQAVVSVPLAVATPLEVPARAPVPVRVPEAVLTPSERPEIAPGTWGLNKSSSDNVQSSLTVKNAPLVKI
jgi:hypothetical protein